MNLKNKVSETMLLTVSAKYEESIKQDGLFYDETAVSLYTKLKLKKKLNFLSQVGTAIRVDYFDRVLIDFCTRKEKPLIVILGCGLDDRFGRLNIKGTNFYNIDFPDVINLRNELFHIKYNNNYDIKSSILDKEYLIDIKNKNAGANPIFILEGVSMYLNPSEINDLITNIYSAFEKFEIWFDALSPVSLYINNHSKIFKELNVKFKWSVKNPKNLKRLIDKEFEILDYQSMFTLKPSKWGIYYYIFTFIPLLKNGANLIGLEFDSSPNHK